MSEPTKICTSCYKHVPLSGFYARNTSPDGLRHDCKECTKTRNRAYYKNRDVVQRQRSLLDSHLRRRYGIDLVLYEVMVGSRGGRCDICDQVPAETNRNNMRLHVDHDHATERVRGLLCGPCNRALGLMRDDPALLRGAASYLEES